MEKILNFLGIMKKKEKKKFPKKAKPNTNFLKSNLKTDVKKIPLHVLKTIYSYLDLESEQIQFSLLCKKFKKTFFLCCEEIKKLSLKSSYPENILHYLFHILNEFKSIKKLTISGIKFDKYLLDDFYKCNMQNLISLKILNTQMIRENYNELNEDIGKFCDFIATNCKNLEKIYFNSFYGYQNNKYNSNPEISLYSNRLFADSFKNLKKLTITNSFLDNFYFDDIPLKMNKLSEKFPNLELIDLSRNKLKSQIYLNPNFFSFGFSHKIKKIILNNNEINVIFRFLPYNIKLEDLPENQIYDNYELIDISDNYIDINRNFDKFKNNFPNLLIKLEKIKKRRNSELIMRMLFSRSGIIADEHNKEVNDNKLSTNNESLDYQNKYNILEKQKENFINKSLISLNHKIVNPEGEFQFNSYPKLLKKKTNGAVLPCIVYDSVAKISFDRETLIKILQKENKLRLSDFAKSAYDENFKKDKNFHLNLDLLLIKKALMLSGFNPESDDSLKAYHLATKKYIADPQVMNSVVWMKYDKCKIGKYSIGDKPDYKNIKVYDFDKNEFLLKNLILNKNYKKNINNNKIFNLIVSGSLS